MDSPGARRPRAVRNTLFAVIAVALVLLGGGLAVALGIGRTEAPTADSVDAGFSRDMGRHHLQAVEMANLALDRSHDPAVRGLAFDIEGHYTTMFLAMLVLSALALWLTLRLTPAGINPRP